MYTSAAFAFLIMFLTFLNITSHKIHHVFLYNHSWRSASVPKVNHFLCVAQPLQDTAC